MNFPLEMSLQINGQLQLLCVYMVHFGRLGEGQAYTHPSTNLNYSALKTFLFNTITMRITVNKSNAIDSKHCQ